MRTPTLYTNRAHRSVTSATGQHKQLLQPRPQRYAVIGGGFAGLATAWHLLQHSTPERPIALDLFEAHGLAAGGSGAAAGLLHPYTPRGKLLWQGLPAFNEALVLAAVAEAEGAAAVSSPPLLWRHGLLRPARTPKQAKDLLRHVPSAETEVTAATGARCIENAAELAALVPGIEASAEVGLLVEKAIVLSPHRYLEALWRACQRAAAASSPAASAQLLQRPVASLQDLRAEAEESYDAVVVAAGAAVGSIRETAELLPLDLCHGYSLEMRPKEEGRDAGAEFPPSAPSLLGSPYIAMHGTKAAVVGATQRHNASPAEAQAALGSGGVIDLWKSGCDGSEAAQAAKALADAATAQLWPPLAGWEVARVRSGFRAIPERTAEGSIPYAGRIPCASGENGRQQQRWWVVGGLGARGLLYHAWLGKLVAAALVADTEAELPAELLRWQADKKDRDRER